MEFPFNCNITQDEIDLSILEDDEEFEEYVAENSKNANVGEVDQEAWEDNWEDDLDKMPKNDKAKPKQKNDKENKGKENKSKAKSKKDSPKREKNTQKRFGQQAVSEDFKIEHKVLIEYKREDEPTL